MPSSYRQILVDGSPVGLHGLDELFLTLRAAGCKPGDAGLGLEIVEHMRRENYIPHSANDVFAAALNTVPGLHRQGQGSGGRSVRVCGGLQFVCHSLSVQSDHLSAAFMARGIRTT